MLVPYPYIPNPYLDEINQINGTDSLELNSYLKRGELTKKYSFAIPSQIALETIAKYSPIIEIGAGSGYWAYLLDQIPVDIEAFDKEQAQWDWNKKWFPVNKGDHTIVQRYPYRTLFLCWPNYDDDFAVETLKRYPGETFIYVGEGEGGCVANDAFFKELRTNWEEIESIAIPQWAGIHDYLSVYKRKLN